MSFDNPPPAPRRGLSPWAWVGIGCASLSVLGFGGCIAVGAVIANRVQQEMKKPFNLEEARVELKDVPLYPGAKVSEEMSKAGRAGMSVFNAMLPARSAVVLAVESDDPTEKIFNWYDTEMGKLAYKEVKVQTQSGMSQQHQYQREKDMVIVQVQPSKNGNKAIMLMRFNDLKKR